MVLTQNSRIEAYINEVCSQIEFREVYHEIKLELETHLQEIIEDYLSKDFSEDEAVDKAIAQMGGANVVGKQLNNIHKSKPEWSILIISLFFVSIGLLTMFFIEKQGLFTTASSHIFTKSLVFTIIGAVIVTGLYLFDYRKLEPYSKQIYLCTVLVLVFIIIFGQRVNGKPYLEIGPIFIDIVEISPLLFSMALAGIANKWNWDKPKWLLQGLLLCVVPLILMLVSCSLSAGIIYSITCTIIMIVSGERHRKFQLSRGLVHGVIMLVIIGVPCGLMRLIDIPKFISYYHTDFIFSFINCTFSWIAGCILAALVFIFIIRMTCMVTIVKNNYGKLLISGLVTIFTVRFLWNILMNLGLAPISGVGLPLISFGGSQLIFNATALGIILSIYRLRNITKTLINS
ncbi:MAG: FtsW/RodA/SpoVE family cell cycle protein [Bacteroidales bacterium]|nr:FtsW/RodA/SpoVE family cell cycle protein [Bacteroidales bacterium]